VTRVGTLLNTREPARATNDNQFPTPAFAGQVECPPDACYIPYQP
jgi:hypothetical protein